MMVLWRAGIAWSLLGSSSLVVGAGPIPVRVASSHVLCLLQTYYPPHPSINQPLKGCDFKEGGHVLPDISTLLSDLDTTTRRAESAQLRTSPN